MSCHDDDCPFCKMEKKEGALCGTKYAALIPNSELKKSIASKETESLKSAETVSGVKYDQLKPRWSLFPDKTLSLVLAVLEHGAKKYAIFNWTKVPNPEIRYYDAAMRHLEARKMGWYMDKESKLPHLAHAICCLLFLLWFDIKKRKGHK